MSASSVGDIEARFVNTFVQRAYRDRYLSMLKGKKRQKALLELIDAQRFVSSRCTDITGTIDTVLSDLDTSVSWYVMTPHEDTDGALLPLMRGYASIEFGSGGILLREDMSLAIVIGEYGKWRVLMRTV